MKIDYTEKDKKTLMNMLNMMFISGDDGLLWTTSEIDWNLPGDCKTRLRRYRINVVVYDNPPFADIDTTPENPSPQGKK